jgi:dipeptidyl-peptidase-3
MSKLAELAPEFEKAMPWLDQYKRQSFRPPVATAVQVLALSGGASPVTPAGINLPNEQAIRETQGSKSFFLTSVDDAASAIYSKAIGSEFLYESGKADEYKRCLPAVQVAKVALHEVIGYGSGRVNPGLTRDPKEILKDYGAALEEARAELVALHSIFSPKAVEAGLIPDATCARVMAEYYPIAFQLRLRLIPTGETIEQDHVRAQSLIVNYAVQKGAVKMVEKDGKKFLTVPNVSIWQSAIAELLAEVMRIKAEGDYDKGKALIETYGRRLDPALRDDSVRRSRTIGLPAHLAFLGPKIKPLKNGKGEVTDATVVDSLGIVQSALVDAGKAELP